MNEKEVKEQLELIKKELPDACGMEPPSGWALEPVLYGLTRLVEHLITVSTKQRGDEPG